MNDDTDLFRQQFSDVMPLPQDRTALSHHAPDPSEAQLARRQAAVESPDKSEPLSLSEPPQLAPDALVAFKRPGIQDGVFKKLRLGKYPISARLDLHQRRIEDARRQVLRFINTCQQQDQRCVLIIHGKGQRSNPPARLKSYISHWLPQLPIVMAIHSAQPNHGGYGALYVLLRKSNDKKIENRERHARRLG